MHTTTTWIAGVLLAATSGLTPAAPPDATTRDERMDAALANYRAAHPSDMAAAPDSASADCNEYSNGGRFARAEAALKRGACKTGHAIERGVKKTGDALRRTGEKMGGSPDKATNDPQPR